MDAYDHDLLTRFRTRRDEDAFRQLVQRHLGMIYAVSYRVTGSREQADEIAQFTFARLADPSVGITRETALAGWLYQTARHLALSAIRSDARRRQREQIAAAMNLNEPSPNVVAEYLEPAMEQLAPDDRDALLLRFFEDRSLREVGRELGLSEDAARMRVNRALEKMRGVFARLGITASATWLASTLTTSATVAVPTGLGATITTAVLSGAAVATATAALVTQTTATTMYLFNLKTAAAILAAAAVTGTTTYLVQERETDQLRAENSSINETHAKLMSDRQEAMALVQRRDEQIERLRKEVADLPRLRGEVDSLNRKLAALTTVEAENDQLKQMVTNVAQKSPSNYASILELTEALSKEREWHAKERYAHLLGAALATAADGNGGEFPDTIEAAKPFMGDSFYGGARVLGILVRADDFEICYKGRLAEIKDPKSTILLREIEPVPRFRGIPSRICLYADLRAVPVVDTNPPRAHQSR